MKRLRLLPALLLLAPLALPLAGCDANDLGDPNDDVAPPVVAPEAFSFDSSFPEAEEGARLFPGANFLNGYARVVIVSAAVGVHLVIPAAVTEAATDEDPFVDDGTWIWENAADVEGNDLTFRLEGTPDGTEIEWRMLISSEEPIEGQVYDDFVLYTATTDLDGRSGTWRLFYLIEGEPTGVLDAEFDVTSETEAELTFSVPPSNPDPDAVGETIRYASDGADRLFDWHQEPEDYDHLIEWDAVTHAGSITATDYNGGERACWDEDLEDAACEG